MCVSKRKTDKENENKTTSKEKLESKEIQTKNICTEGVSENIMQKIPWETERK
jgi:hypothetical protein